MYAEIEKIFEELSLELVIADIDDPDSLARAPVNKVFKIRQWI